MVQNPVTRTKTAPGDHLGLDRFVNSLPRGAVYVVRPTLDGGLRVAAWRGLLDLHPRVQPTSCRDCARGPCSIALMPGEDCPHGCGCSGGPPEA